MDNRFASFGSKKLACFKHIIPIIALACVCMGITSCMSATSSGNTIYKLSWAEYIRVDKTYTGQRSTEVFRMYYGLNGFVYKTGYIDWFSYDLPYQSFDCGLISGSPCSICKSKGKNVLAWLVVAVLLTMISIFYHVRRVRSDSLDAKQKAVACTLNAFICGFIAFASYRPCYVALGLDEGDDDQDTVTFYSRQSTTKGYGVAAKLCVTCFSLQMLLTVLSACIPVRDAAEKATGGEGRANTEATRSPVYPTIARKMKQAKQNRVDPAAAFEMSLFESAPASTTAREPTHAGAVMAKVLFSFAGSGHTEMALTRGDFVEVLQRGKPGAYSQGLHGKFPTDYVQFPAQASQGSFEPASASASPPAYSVNVPVAASGPETTHEGAVMAKVLYDYAGSGPNEMKLTQGEYVEVLTPGNPGAFSQGLLGKFPTDYVQFVTGPTAFAELEAPPVYAPASVHSSGNSQEPSHYDLDL